MITILAGGTGSVRLVRGLARTSRDLAIICNVGDNIWLNELYVCPDIDTITYGLAGILDAERGWGIRNDTFSFTDQMKKMGKPSWFRLGDRDLATHVFRTEMLRRGKNLTEITRVIAKMFGVTAKILPVTDKDVTTIISTSQGEMHLQEFWVKNRARPIVKDVHFKGAKNAIPTNSAVDAIRKSERVIVAPANPISSIGPIIAIPGIRRELQRIREKVVAISPLIGHRAISGPAVKYMKAQEIEVSPIGVSSYYKDVVSSIIIAKSDKSMKERIEKLGIKPIMADIMMKGSVGEDRLARFITKDILS